MGRRTTAVGMLLAVLTAIQGWSTAAYGVSTTTITGWFGDSCRHFEAHSGKDISHVEIHYADGRVVKDESINRPDFAIDGGPGNEIASTRVKSGRTPAEFECPDNEPPTALLEARRMRGEGADTWTSEDAPLCPNIVSPCWQSDPTTGTTLIPFRGANSTDPNNDIVAWSIDFGDGTSTGTSSWTDNPPVYVEHTYSSARNGGYTVVLTVTDSAGHVSSDTMTVVFDTDHED